MPELELPGTHYFGCAYYFGRWQHPGHFLYHTNGQVVRPGDAPFDTSTDAWLDGSLAPRQASPLLVGRYGIGSTCYIFLGNTSADRQFIRDRSLEAPQGRFLLHWIRGHTLIAWWDRTQGDKRQAGNSVFIVEGERTATEMLELWPQCFPLQAQNLDRAGITLREIGS